MKHYCLPNGSLVERKVMAFDHWVSANTIEEARHKIAWQIVNGNGEGKFSEPIIVMNGLGVNWVKAHIDNSDLEIGE